MRILVWHVHGSWTTAFVQGPHEYLIPVTPGRGPDGRGRARTWTWPGNAVEVSPEQLATEHVDVVILQRPVDEHLAEEWLGGRRPGKDVPAVWLEHNAPQGRIDEMRHPAADRRDLVVVHVTPNNALMWDTGSTAVRVIDHGVPDPGYRYTGSLPHGAIVVNEPERRGRVVGADLYPLLAAAGPLDLFGMGCARMAAELAARDLPVRGHENPTQAALHDLLAERRVYVHPYRWTSLGLALIEAMLLGMPVVVLGATEAPFAVPPAAGVVSNRPERLAEGLRELLADPGAAADAGRDARRAALERFSLDRFLGDWDALLEQVTDDRGWS